MATPTPAATLKRFIGKFSAPVQGVAVAALAKMRARLPGAVELVYDNYNALAIGFGPGERASEVIFSIALYPRWVTLFFLRGAALTDADGILQGSGNQVRHIVLESAATLDQPAVRRLMKSAVAQAGRAIDPKGRRRIVIKSVSAKQRPRRPPAGRPLARRA
jgi:hypothetical protein